MLLFLMGELDWGHGIIKEIVWRLGGLTGHIVYHLTATSHIPLKELH